MTNLFKLHHSQYIKKIETGANLYSHLMEYGYLPDHWVLPPFVEIKTKNTAQTGDTKTRDPKVLFAPKSKLKWRQFSFTHPNNYQKACEVIASKEYNDALLKLAVPTKIFSYTLPQTYTSSTQNAEKQIIRWTELQDDLLLFSDKYEYMLVLDISNCYHTLYTHSIEWAFESIGDKKNWRRS
jgi:hypothetical protein